MYIGRLVQEIRNSIANALELRLALTHRYASVSQDTIGSNYDLLIAWCLVNIWNNAEVFISRPMGTNFSEIFIKMQHFS